MSRHLLEPPAAHGHTLIELLIVLALIAILASLAYPDYSDAVRRGHRVDARNSLTAIQIAQARYQGRHGRYARRLSELGWAEPVSDEGYYRLELDPSVDPTQGFLAHARPREIDEACPEMRIDAQGPVIANEAERACWR